MEPDLKKVSTISQRHKDIVFGYINQVQSVFPDENSYFNIVSLIQHLILLYYYMTFESTILTDIEQEEFLDLLKKNNKPIIDYPWKLLYKATRDGLEQKVFVDKVFDHPNVIMLWQIKGESVIGGYTKTGWNKDGPDTTASAYDYNSDKDAFVFYFKSPEKYKPCISNIKQDGTSISRATGNHTTLYAGFGDSYIFYFNNQNKLGIQSNSSTNNYQQLPHGKGWIHGDVNRRHHDVKLEIFQIQM